MGKLERLFGNHSSVKILEVLANKDNISRWLSLREIARQAGDINPGTAKRSIDVLVSNKIVEEQRPSKNMRIFKLNQDDKVVREFIKFYQSVD